MANDIIVFNIREFFSDKEDKVLGEEALQRILSEFSCERNSDVERFLKNSAIEFTRKNQSLTYLVFSVEDGELLGYFTIALKPLTVRGETVSNTVKRKLFIPQKVPIEQRALSLATCHTIFVPL